MTRPVYCGFGWCQCGRVDVRLYCVPGTPLAHALLCSLCLKSNGYDEPRARTADDIVVVDGQYSWKDEDKK